MNHSHEPPEPTMHDIHSNERGNALIMALGALTILAVIAIVIVAVVVSEKRTAFSEYSGSRSFYSADAASEAGVNWLEHQYTPAAVVDTSSHVFVADTFTTIGQQNGYRFNVQYMARRYRPGWSTEYKDYEYRVDATGQSAQQAAASIRVGATRLYREGY
jgi:Tfp pilus assembly protein PilX